MSTNGKWHAYPSDIVLYVEVSPGSGGLNLTGSRLLMLSKNSEFFRAGVEGITTLRVSCGCDCLLRCAGIVTDSLTDCSKMNEGTTIDQVRLSTVNGPSSCCSIASGELDNRQ